MPDNTNDRIVLTAYALEALSVALERARRFAVAAKMDEHFTSEIDHLLATTNHNKGE